MNQNITIFLICICFMFVFGRIIITPLRIILKILINSFFGALLLWIINLYWRIFLGFQYWNKYLDCSTNRNFGDTWSYTTNFN